MNESLFLETRLLLLGFEKLFVFPLCYQLVFFYLLFFYISQSPLTAICPAPQFARMNSFELLLVLTLMWSPSSQFRRTPFRLHLAFVRPYLQHLGHIIARSWYLCTAVFDVFFLSGDTDIIQLFLQVEIKKYCHCVKVPRIDETGFNCVFDEWVFFLQFFF